MAKKKKLEQKARSKQEKMKWEVADDLNLDDDLRRGGDSLSVREAGKIGGNVTKKLVEKGKEAMKKEE
jgi:hypothetical protein